MTTVVTCNPHHADKMRPSVSSPRSDGLDTVRLSGPAERILRCQAGAGLDRRLLLSSLLWSLETLTDQRTVGLLASVSPRPVYGDWNVFAMSLLLPGVLSTEKTFKLRFNPLLCFLPAVGLLLLFFLFSSGLNPLLPGRKLFLKAIVATHY